MSSASLNTETSAITGSDDVSCSTGEYTPLNNEEHDQSIAKGGVTTPFPWKLHIMLDYMEEHGDKSIACWQPHGRAFIVHKPKDFVVQIMPQFFNQTKYASFQRQLNLYGFSRLTHGVDKGAYFHACFVRGERDLCRKMIRQKIKGTKVRKSLSPEEEPNFYTMTGKLPTIPSEESIAEQQQEQSKKNRKSATASRQVNSPHEITPKHVKPVKRSSARRSSNADSSVMYPLVVQHQQPSQQETLNSNTSYAMLPSVINPLPLPPSTRTVSPHQSSSTLYEKTCQQHVQLQQQQDLPYVPQVSSARGGDLLFFEGQPFRYLESVSNHESPIAALTSASDVAGHRSSLQDMITTIVNLDNQYQTQPPEKPLPQLSCTNYNERSASHVCSV